MADKNEKMGNMADLYDHEAKPFAAKAPQLVWWTTLGMPAYERHLSNFFERPDVSIADLGSASARVESFLMEKGIPATCFTGVEISPDQVAIARNTIPDAKFIVGDISSVTLPDESFDLVISNMVLEFLDPDQLEKTFANVQKWLKPGGTFFFITTHPAKMQMTSGLSEPGVFKVDFPWGGHGPNYYRTVEDFEEALRKAGLIIDVMEELNLPPEAQQIDPKEYARYMQYPHTRLVIKASKPA